MTPEQVDKLKTYLYNHIGNLESAMHRARKEGDINNYFYYDGEVYVCQNVLRMIYAFGAEQEEQKEAE